MKFFYIEPEVAGGFGKNTVLDASFHPPKVDKLHYQFDGWLGDAILESFPCFIVTETAAKALVDAKATGVQYEEVEVSVSVEFQELCPESTLPRFLWLKINGIAGTHDFGIAGDLRLVISERALSIIRLFGVENSVIDSFP